MENEFRETIYASGIVLVIIMLLLIFAYEDIKEFMR